MSFENIVGNTKIKQELKNVANSNAVSHSYLFVGEEGIGKKQIAREFAKMILCLSQEKEKCNQCDSCIKFISNNNPDFIEISEDGNSIKIAQIRELQEKIYQKPIVSSKKVVIIDNSEKMTEEAQNSLLKTLEEPPEYIVIILITSNENKLLNTIKSRCLKLSFVNIDNKEMLEYIEKNQDIQKPSQSILDLSNGGIGRLIKINDNIEEYNQVDGITKDMINSNIRNVVKLINQYEVLYKSKEIIFDLLDYMIAIVYSHIKKNADYRSKFINIIGIINNAKTKLNSNTNYDMCIDEMLFKIWEEIDENNSRS